MQIGKTPLEKEWFKVEKQEQKFLQKREEKTESKLNRMISEKVPKSLQDTLDVAFEKAFWLVFEKGTGVIEKTYSREELEKNYQVNEYAAQVKNDRKSLKAFSKKAAGSSAVNTLLSGASGIGLGVLGIGIPDIAVFTGMMLKSIYEIALSYGFDYKSEEEKEFILIVIQGAVSYGEELKFINKKLNYFMETGTYIPPASIDRSIREAAKGLSGELLYMKFLQGIPIVGAVGGAYDVVYMKQIVKYAQMKYRRRFYRKRMKREEQ